MIRECDSSRCRRIYVSLDTDKGGLCPTCTAGMPPLSTLVDGKPGLDLRDGVDLTGGRWGDRHKRPD